jgi:hypothetical protein
MRNLRLMFILIMLCASLAFLVADVTLLVLVSTHEIR